MKSIEIESHNANAAAEVGIDAKVIKCFKPEYIVVNEKIKIPNEFHEAHRVVQSVREKFTKTSTFGRNGSSKLLSYERKQ